jgi:hypothetical protein
MVLKGVALAMNGSGDRTSCPVRFPHAEIHSGFHTCGKILDSDVLKLDGLESIREAILHVGICLLLISIHVYETQIDTTFQFIRYCETSHTRTSHQVWVKDVVEGQNR